ncbi:MAG: dihydroorotase [Gammaproteobacteria bacterium RIFCSPLOWO2_02_FULL_61_13]|nr:MAG: dihydroorotase [Gammaproteobacteria bacterium RIFCSPLOWO2_02_FULL_61_13]
MNSITITRPDDMHLHLRDGAELASVIGASARCFARGIVMPNLMPPVTTVPQALAYRERILRCAPPAARFVPLMTLYLTDTTAPLEIRRARDSGLVFGVKLYPAGATTHSDSGVTDISRTHAVMEALAVTGLPLLVHGEVTDANVDIFDREAVFIDRVLAPLLQRFPSLRVVFEHVTTHEAVEFVRTAPANVAATITPQHLLYNRNALFHGGLRPHYYCLPVLKAEAHRRALLEAACSGSPKFFLGTDSAPHERATKESACGCAGCFSAPAAIELYAQAFDQAGALNRLDDFAARHGAAFYGLPRNTETITLDRQEWTVPAQLPFAAGAIVPLAAGETCQWKMMNS